MPFYTERERKEGDVVFVMKNQTFEAIVTAIQYLTLLGPYGGFTAVNYPVFLRPHSTDVNMRNAQIGSRAYLRNSTSMARSLTVAENAQLPGGRSLPREGS